MSLLDRMSTEVKAKINKIIGKMEDPRETLDYSYEKQIELLQNVKRSVAEVATSKKRLELQKAKLQESINKLPRQGRPWNPIVKISQGWPWSARSHRKH